MHRLRSLALLALASGSLPFVAKAEQTADPILTGYVTEVRGTVFAVNGRPIQLAPGASFGVRRGAVTTILDHPGPPYLGEPVTLYGKADRKTKGIVATEVLLPSPGATVEVRGSSVIYDVAGSASAGDGVLSADGYRLTVSPRTRLTFDPANLAAAQIRAGMWISYQGFQQKDGTVLLDAATVTDDSLTPTEERLRDKTEFDPSAVRPEDKQGKLSKAVLGYDPKRLPAHQDPALQARVQRLGDSVVPAYQRSLPPGDSGHIDFRFQVVDADKLKAPIALTSGVVLVPYAGLQRMENDAQIAALLAPCVAVVLEKQAVRQVPARHGLTAASLLGEAGGVIVPGLGIATELTTGGIQSRIERLAAEQSARVGLELLARAGYDLAQAPVAWWRLAAKDTQAFARSPLPVRSREMYKALGTTWRSQLEQPAGTAAGQAP